ncbi:MAG: DUF1571 domain-containing protein [Bacteroidota bacterium]|nr:DUF1571 domain-containing protein [Bacteroidota bacterium]
MKYRILFAILSLLPFNVFGQNAVFLTRQMFSTVKSLKTLQFSFESKERLKKELHIERSSFKLSIHPFKVYIYQHFPKNGIECLYVSGKNNEKVKVRPNAFPWVNLNLDPEGELVLQGRHHSFFDSGFGYTVSLLEYLLNKYESQSSKVIECIGVEKYQGIECYHLVFNHPAYRMVTYVTQSDETPLSIAQKLHLNFYSILENNAQLKGIGTIKAGTRLIVPNDYASKMDMYVHKDKFYPVHLKIYDAKGLFEEYTFTQVVLNPTFKDIDFSDKNPAYKF